MPRTCSAEGWDEVILLEGEEEEGNWSRASMLKSWKNNFDVSILERRLGRRVVKMWRMAGTRACGRGPPKISAAVGASGGSASERRMKRVGGGKTDAAARD